MKTPIVQNQEEEEFSDYDPYKSLLAAILERSIRDLASPDQTTRLKSVKWFIKWENTSEEDVGFSFKDVMDNLSLPEKCMEFIGREVYAARNGVGTSSIKTTFSSRRYGRKTKFRRGVHLCDV